MLGHSMGSLIVRLCLPECGTELAGSILIGTAGPNAAALSAAHIADSIARTRGVTLPQRPVEQHRLQGLQPQDRPPQFGL